MDDHDIFIVTIDGPAASGKSSVSRELAHRFGWSWLSTGAFYRGLAYVAHIQKADLTDEAALEKLARSDLWSVQMGRERTSVFVSQPDSQGKSVTSASPRGSVDVTDEINKEEIGSLASKISSFPRVRRALLDAQRKCTVGVTGLVAEGRDCGTVVFPDANLKVFLTARAEDRAARRAREEGRDLDQTIGDQKQRDAQDAGRSAAPMRASQDSYTIDTTDRTLLEVVDQVESLVLSCSTGLPGIGDN